MSRGPSGLGSPCGASLRERRSGRPRAPSRQPVVAGPTWSPGCLEPFRALRCAETRYRTRWFSPPIQCHRAGATGRRGTPCLHEPSVLALRAASTRPSWPWALHTRRACGSLPRAG